MTRIAGERTIRGQLCRKGKDVVDLRIGDLCKAVFGWKFVALFFLSFFKFSLFW